MRAFAKRGKSFTCMLLALICTLLMGMTLVVSADSKANATVDQQAKDTLTGYVSAQLSANEYAVEGGGTLSGSDLFEKSGNGYDLNETEFNKLTSRAQSELVSDIAEKSNEAAASETGTTKNVSDSTVQSWWKELQQKNGVGSKFMNEILKNTKPDFVTANAIYQPFSGPVSTILGVIAILIMAFLGIVMAADIAYITLPPVRMLVADGDSSGRPEKSKIFSYDAIYAVKCAESDSSASGNGKQALGIYLKRRIIALIILGICLLYLVQGQLYTFVGMILDLVSGFLGF